MRPGAGWPPVARGRFCNVTLSKTLLVVALLAGGYQLWSGHQRAHAAREALLGADVNGFIDVLMPDGAPPHAVLVFAPVNCPSDGAKRADEMSKELTARGIPNIRASNYYASSLKPDQTDLIKRTYVVLGGTIPTVMVDGKGKANPTLDEIAAEYHRDL